jgi:hypothetical protein
MVTFPEFLAGVTVFGLIVMFAAWFNGGKTIRELGAKMDNLGKIVVEENELTRKELGEMRSEMRDLLTKILHAIEARGV